MNEQDIARFWSKVDRSGGPKACHPWTAGRFARGYGAFWLEGKTIRAHRVAFFLTNGKWPDPFGCHSCDNPPCCNGGHIFEGTQLDNDMDRVAKGRSVFGELHGRSRLSDAAAADILRSLTMKDAELAVKHGVSRRAVRFVRTGRTWRHVIP